MSKAIKSPNNNKTLVEELNKLRLEIRKNNSFKNKFIAGLLTGLGTVLGATVLVALLIFILSQLASIEIIKPFIENIVEVVQTTKK